MDVDKVLEILKRNGMNINKDKCEFNKAEIEFLGHVIKKESLKPKRDKMEAIIDFSAPRNVRKIRRFCGMIKYYHQFIPRCSELFCKFN